MINDAVHIREVEKLVARVLWLEKRLTEREELVSSLLDELARLRRQRMDIQGGA